MAVIAGLAAVIRNGRNLKTEVTKVEDEKNMVILKVEVPADKIMPTIEKAYKEVSQKVRIPGFRKGKIPPQIIDQMIGQDAVMNEAVNDLIPIFYPEAVESSGLEPVSQPQVNIEQIEKDKPFIFTAKIELKPEVKLGDYSVIELPKIPTKATKKEVEDNLKKMRERFSQLELAKRAVKKGDYALIDYQGYIDGRPFEGGTTSEQMMEVGAGLLIPGFEDALIGMKKNEEKDVNLTFPKNYQPEDLAGRNADFHIVVKEVKTKKLPKLDDDFVKSISKYETLDEFKKSIKLDIEETKKKEEESAKRDGAIDYITETSEVDLPAGMVEQQINMMVKEFEKVLEREKTDLQKYLKNSNDTYKGFRENFRDEANKRIKTNLVLEAVMEAENINVGEAEIEDEIRRLAENSKQDYEDLKAELTDEHIDYLKGQLRVMKAIDFLIERVKFVKSDDITDKAGESPENKTGDEDEDKLTEELKMQEINNDQPDETIEDFSVISGIDETDEKLEEGDDEE